MISSFKETATAFLDFINRSYAKRQSNFNYHLKRLKLADIPDATDIFNDTILLCYDAINKKGFNSKAFGAYFDKAAEFNLINYNKSNAKNKLTSIETTDDEYHDDCFVSAITDYQMQQYEDKQKENMVSDTIIRQKLATDFNALCEFKALPEKYREVLMMRSNGLKYREIARILGIKVGQTKMRLKTARDIIKNKLENKESNVSPS